MILSKVGGNRMLDSTNLSMYSTLGILSVVPKHDINCGQAYTIDTFTRTAAWLNHLFDFFISTESFRNLTPKPGFLDSALHSISRRTLIERSDQGGKAGQLNCRKGNTKREGKKVRNSQRSAASEFAPSVAF